MIHPEFSESPFDDIDKEFAALVSGEGQQTYNNHIVRSLDKEKTLILDALVDHLIAFDKVDATSTYEKFSTAVDMMVDAMTKDFEQIEGINYEDEIIASGKTIALFTDKDDLDCEVLIHPLHDGQCVRGEIDGIFIQEIPAVECLQSVIESNESPVDTTNNNLFGISLRLKNTFIENDEGDIEPVPDNYVVTIPLNYPTLKLYAVIKTENAR